MTDLVCPTCPLCGAPPLVIVGTAQAFCSNANCPAMCWDPSTSLDENLLDAHPVTFHEVPREDPHV